MLSRTLFGQPTAHSEAQVKPLKISLVSSEIRLSGQFTSFGSADLGIGATVVVVVGMVSSDSTTMVVVLDVGNVDETSDSDAVELHAARDTQAVKAMNNFFIRN